MSVDTHGRWQVHMHRMGDDDWSEGSYGKLPTISSTEDFFLTWGVGRVEGVKNYIRKAHFFFMREGVFPTWEHPRNRDGGCVLLSLRADDVDGIESVLVEMMSESLLPDNPQWVNGISIAPKDQRVAVKVWLATSQAPDVAASFRIPGGMLNGANFRPHKK
jgi:hypothetical protein